jgi:hypothetical protein
LQAVRCNGAFGCHALSFLRGITSDIRTAKAFFDCFFAYSSSRPGITRGTLGFVTCRRFPSGLVGRGATSFVVRDHSGHSLAHLYFEH